jgi:outer membrane lipopolysaccharide assembly protein LptE/RlpB
MNHYLVGKNIDSREKNIVYYGKEEFAMKVKVKAETVIGGITAVGSIFLGLANMWLNNKKDARQKEEMKADILKEMRKEMRKSDK